MALPYFGNVAKSFAYSLPTWAANKLPGTTSYARQFTREKRAEVREELIKSRMILKENVLGVLSGAWDKGVENAKKGHLFGDPNAEPDFKAMGFDLDFDDTGDGGDSFDFSEGSMEGMDDAGSQPSEETRAIGKMGATVGGAVARAANSIANSPAAQVTAAATEETMRLSRRSMFLQFGALSAIKAQTLVSNDILQHIHNFQQQQQQEYYKQALTHYTAMSTMTASLDTKLERLIETSGAIVTATDAITRLSSGDRETDFQKVVDADGSFNLAAYLGVVNKRLNDMFGQDSMFKTFGSMVAANPLETIAGLIVEGIIGPEGLNAFEKFETFLSDMTYTLTDRFNTWVMDMMFDESVAKRLLGNVLEKLTIQLPTFSGTTTDLGRYAKSEAVAFDGYAHKALTEVIPSLLGDIHGDTAGMLRVWGGEPAGKKLFDYETGRFTTKDIAMGQRYTDIDRSLRSGFSNFTSLLDSTDTEGLSDALSALAMSNIRIPDGGVDDVRSLFDPVVQNLKSRIDLAMENDDESMFDQLTGQMDQLERGMETLRRQAGTFSTHEEFLARLNAGMLRARSEYATAKAQQASSTEMDAYKTAQRDYTEMEEREDSDWVALNAKLKGAYEAENVYQTPEEILRRKMLENQAKIYEKSTSTQARAQEIYKELNDQTGTWMYGYGREMIETPYGSQALFRGEDGGVSVGGILRSPAVLASRAFENIERRVSHWLFGRDGRKEGDEEEDGEELTGGEALDPDGTDPEGSSGKIKRGLGILGRFRSRLSGLGGRIRGMMFGKKDISFMKGMKGWFTREGGFFDGLRKKLDARILDPLSSYLLGKRKDDGTREEDGLFSRTWKIVTTRMEKMWGLAKGKATDLGKKITDSITTPVKRWLLGEKEVDEEGNVRVARKGVVDRVQEHLQKHIFNPVKEYFLGTTDEDGKKVKMGLFDRIREEIFKPLKINIFGEKEVDEEGNVRIVKEGLVQRFSAQILQPFKDMGSKMADRLWRDEDSLFGQIRAGMGKAFTDIKVAIFGEGASDKTVMEMLGEKLNVVVTKVTDRIGQVFKPVGDWLSKMGQRMVDKMSILTDWLTHPETGLIAKASTWIEGHIARLDEKIFGENGLMGKISKGIHIFFYGDGTEENPGVFKKYLEGIKDFLKTEIWNPLADVLKRDWERVKTFFAEELIKPLKGTLQPFIDELKYSLTSIREWFAGPFANTVSETMKSVGMEFNNFFAETFGKGIKEMLVENVLDPIREALSSVKEFLGGALKALLKIPVNVIRTLADDLRARQIRRGQTGNISLEDQARIIRERGIGRDEYDSTGALEQQLAAYDEIQAREEDGEKGATGKRGFFSRLARRMGRGVNVAAKAGASGVIGGAAAVAKTAPGVAGGMMSGTGKAMGTIAGEEKAPKGVAEGVKDKVKPKTPIDEIKTPIVETKDIIKDVKGSSEKIAEFSEKSYVFMRDNLAGAGKNLYRIAKSLGADTIDGMEGKDASESKGGIIRGLGRFMKTLVKSPFKAVKMLFDGLMKPVTKALSLATKAITLPFRMLGRVLEGLGSVVQGATKAFGALVDGVARVATVLAGAFVDALGMVLKGITDLTGAIGGVIKSLAEAAGSILITITRIAATITQGVVKILGDAALAITKVAGSLVKSAVGAVATGVGSLLGSIFGRKDKQFGKLTPVYVVGGYLAGTGGGAKTWTGARAGGGRGPIGMVKGWRFFNAKDDREEEEEAEAGQRRGLMGYFKKMTSGIGKTAKGIVSLNMTLISGFMFLGAALLKLVVGLVGGTVGLGLMGIGGAGKALGSIARGAGRMAGIGTGAVATTAAGAGAAAARAGAGVAGGAATAAGAAAAGSGIAGRVGKGVKDAGRGAARAFKSGKFLPMAILSLIAGSVIAGQLDEESEMKGVVEGGTSALTGALTGAAGAGVAALGLAKIGAISGSIIPGIGTAIGAVLGGLLGLILYNSKDVDLSKESRMSAKETMDKYNIKGSTTGEKIGSAMGRFIGGAVGTALGGAVALGTWVSDKAESLSEAALITWDKFTGWFRGNPDVADDGWWGKVKSIPGRMWEITKESWNNGLDWIGEKWADVKEAVSKSDMINNLIDKIKNTIKTMTSLFDVCSWLCDGKKKPDDGYVEENMREMGEAAKSINRGMRYGGMYAEKRPASYSTGSPASKEGMWSRFKRWWRGDPASTGADRSGPAIINVPGVSDGYYGNLSSKYESRGDSGAIGFDRTGGHSYGRYQFATRNGGLKGFMDYLKDKDTTSYDQLMAAGGLEGAAAGSQQFKSAWKSVAQSEAFQGAERGYISTEYYQKIANQLRKRSDFDIDPRSRALKNVMWSTAVQHGPDTSVPHKVLRRTGKDVMDPTLIDEIYKERRTRFPSSTPAVRKAVFNRFDREKAQALEMYAQEQSRISLVGMGESARGAEEKVAGMRTTSSAAPRGRHADDTQSQASLQESNGKMVDAVVEGTNANKEIAESTKTSVGWLEKIANLLETRNKMDEEMEGQEDSTPVARRLARRRGRGGGESTNPFIVPEPSAKVAPILVM